MPDPLDNIRCRLRDVLLLCAASALVLLPGLGQNWNWASREVRFAETIREMAESGDYLIPTLLGEPDPHKPPVMQALAAALTCVVGEPSMLLARMPSALAGICGVLAAYGLGLVLFDRRTALLGGVILLGIFGYTSMACQARPDMVFCAAVLLSSLGMGLGMRHKQRGARMVYFAAAGLAAGAGVVTKGVYGILFPMLFLVLAPLRRNDLSRPRWDWIPLGVGLMAGIAAWVVPVYLRDQGIYLHSVLRQAQEDGIGDKSKPFYTFFLLAPLMTLPFILFLPLAVRDWRRHGYSAPLAIAAAIVLIISCVPKKREHYLLPAYPFFALAIASTILRHGATSLLVRRAAWVLVPCSLAVLPIYSLAILPHLQPAGDPQSIFAKQILSATDQDSQIYCYRGSPAALAWVGRRHDRIHDLGTNYAVIRKTLESAKSGSYLVIPTKRLARLRDEIGPVPIHPVLDCMLAEEKMTLLRLQPP